MRAVTIERLGTPEKYWPYTKADEVYIEPASRTSRSLPQGLCLSIFSVSCRPIFLPNST
jgi:hypothetical protein